MTKICSAFRLSTVCPALALAALVVAPATSRGAVSLLFSTAQVQAAPGASFTFTLSLNATANEQTTGLDYFLVNADSGFFTIATRDLSASAYPDPNAASVSGENLTPRTSDDLGGTTLDPRAPVSGTEQVATYTLAIAANAAPGTYTITTNSLAGTGWVDQSFNDNPFDGQASLVVTVVPEPSGWLLGGGACLLGAIVAWRRRAAC